MIMSTAKTPTELRADFIKELKHRRDNAAKAAARTRTAHSTRAQRAAAAAVVETLEELMYFWMDCVVEGKRFDLPAEVTSKDGKNA